MDQQIPLYLHFSNLKDRAKLGDVTLREILNLLGTDCHYAAVAILIAPFLQPVPLLGLSSFVGPVIAILAYFSFSGKFPWIPKTWAEKKLSSETVSKMAEVGEKLARKLSRFVHVRWAFFLTGPFRFINIVCTIANAILFALPLPVPMSNALPAWAIFFWALSHLEDDGLFALLSYLMSAVTFGFFILIWLGADAGFTKILQG